MTAPGFPRYLMEPNGVRLVSSRDNRTGIVTRYVYPSVRPRHHKLIGLYCIGLAIVGAVGIVVVGVLRGL